MIEVIERILCFLIAASIVIQLAPDESYKKCMKYFTGIIFLILMLGNIFKGLDILENADTGILDNIIGITREKEDYYEDIFNEHYGNLENEEE